MLSYFIERSASIKRSYSISVQASKELERHLNEVAKRLIEQDISLMSFFAD